MKVLISDVLRKLLNISEKLAPNQTIEVGGDQIGKAPEPKVEVTYKDFPLGNEVALSIGSNGSVALVVPALDKRAEFDEPAVFLKTIFHVFGSFFPLNFTFTTSLGDLGVSWDPMDKALTMSAFGHRRVYCEEDFLHVTKYIGHNVIL